MVAPLPVVPLSSGVLPVVRAIGPVLNHVITPVGAIFAVIPVVVVAMVPIIYSQLHPGFLRLRAGQGYRWCGKGSAQKQQAEVPIDMKQDDSSHSENSRFGFPGKLDNALSSARIDVPYSTELKRNEDSDCQFDGKRRKAVEK